MVNLACWSPDEIASGNDAEEVEIHRSGSKPILISEDESVAGREHDEAGDGIFGFLGSFFRKDPEDAQDDVDDDDELESVAEKVTSRGLRSCIPLERHSDDEELYEPSAVGRDQGYSASSFLPSLSRGGGKGKARWLQQRAEWLQVSVSDLKNEPSSFETDGNLMAMLQERNRKLRRERYGFDDSDEESVDAGDARAITDAVRESPIFGVTDRSDEFSYPVRLSEATRLIREVWRKNPPD